MVVGYQLLSFDPLTRQDDGNFVVYSARGSRLFYSSTTGTPGCVVDKDQQGKRLAALVKPAMLGTLDLHQLAVALTPEPWLWRYAVAWALATARRQPSTA